MSKKEKFIVKERNGEVILTKYTGNEKLVRVPEGVTVLGLFAFSEESEEPFSEKVYKYDKVEKIVLPRGVREVHTSFECPALTELVLPESLEVFSPVLYDSERLTSLVIPPNVRVLGRIARSKALTDITVQSEKLISARDSAFVHGYQPESTITAEILLKNPAYKAIDNFLVNTKNMTLLHRIDKTKEAERIPDGIQRIGTGAFSEEDASLRYGKGDSFPADYNEEEIAEMSEEEIRGIKAEDAYWRRFKWLRRIVFSASVVKIDEAAFENCPALEEVVFEARKEDLDLSPYAFKDCPIVRIVFADSEKPKARTRNLMFDRLTIIHRALKSATSGNYPNANDLLKKVKRDIGRISISTVRHDIEFLRDHFYAPIEYDFFEKGYHYTDKNFEIRL